MKILEKRFEHAGYTCEVYLIEGRHRVGYVTVPKNHIAAIIGLYDDVPVSVHGGLTYGADIKEGHTFGFDCAHYNDTLEKWTTKAVVKECKSLAEQLSKVTWKQAVEKKLSWMPEWFVERVVIKEL